MERKVVRYNWSWLLCVLIGITLKIISATKDRNIPISLTGNVFFLMALILCYVNVKNKTALSTIEERKHSLFSMHFIMFKLLASTGLASWVIVLLINAVFYTPLGYILSWIYLLIVMTFIFLWNMGWIRHQNFEIGS